MTDTIRKEFEAAFKSRWKDDQEVSLDQALEWSEQHGYWLDSTAYQFQGYQLARSTPSTSAEPAVAQREPIPESVMRALEFYSATTFSQLNLKIPSSRHLSAALKESPDWEYIGETYHGDDQFVVTTRLANIAIEELREWLETHPVPAPETAKDEGRV